MDSDAWPLDTEEEKHMSRTLTPKQINFGIEQIEKLRVLKSTPIEVVWPFLYYLCCCFVKRRKKPFTLGLKSALRQKLSIKMTKSE